MKIRILILTLLLISCFIGLFIGFPKSNKTDTVRFTATVDIKNATKGGGIYLNDYIVHIPYEDLEKLNGQTIEVNGIVTIVKGLKNVPPQYDKNGNPILSQGRMDDTKHIEKPKYKIINQ